MLPGHVAHLLADENAVADQRELVATVLGEKIYSDQITPAEARAKREELSDADYQKWLLEYRISWLLSRVEGRVLKEYTIREKLSPSDQELDALFLDFSQTYLANHELDDESKQKLALRMLWLKASSCEWRTAKALYERYGGQVAVSSFGACTSIEGRNAVLKAYAEAGELTFHQHDMEQAFWEKTKDTRVLDARVSPERIKGFFAVSPWERGFKALAQEGAATKPEIQD
jgi:hypothetical protein